MKRKEIGVKSTKSKSVELKAKKTLIKPKSKDKSAKK